MKTRSWMTVQQLKDDGTVNIKAVDKSSYFTEVATEVLTASRKFSDVKIVCGDGTRLHANKAILSKYHPLLVYLNCLKKDSNEDVCLLLPDSQSEITKKALLWFYDNSSEQSVETNKQTLDAAKEVFGGMEINFMNDSMLSSTDNPTRLQNSVLIDEFLSESPIPSEDFDQKSQDLEPSGENLWDIFIQKDVDTGEYLCSFCFSNYHQLSDLTKHLSENHDLHVYPLEDENPVMDECESNLDSGQLTSENCGLSKSISCFFCPKIIKNRPGLFRHIALCHIKKEVLLFANLCKGKKCRNLKFTETKKVLHLVFKHKVLEHILTKRQLSIISTKILGSLNESEKENQASSNSFILDNSPITKEIHDAKDDKLLIEPFATRRRTLQITFVKSLENEMENEVLQKWDSNLNMKLIPKRGYVYVFRGEASDFSTVEAADCHSWSTLTRCAKKAKITALLEETKGFQHPMVKVHLRKKIIFLKKPSLYVIFYHLFYKDAQSPNPGEKREEPEKPSLRDFKQETSRGNPDLNLDRPRSQRTTDSSKPSEKTSAYQATTTEFPPPMKTSQPSEPGCSHAQSSVPVDNLFSSTPQPRKRGRPKKISISSPPVIEDPSTSTQARHGPGDFRMNDPEFNEGCFRVQPERPQSTSCKRSLGDSPQPRKLGRPKKICLSSPLVSEDPSNSSQIIHGPRDIRKIDPESDKEFQAEIYESMSSKRSSGDSTLISDIRKNSILHPFATNQEKLVLNSFISKFTNPETSKNVELQTWNSSLFMDPQVGDVFVFHGKEDDVAQVVIADNQHWINNLASPDKSGMRIHYCYANLLKKKILFLRETSTFIVFYSDNKRMAPQASGSPSKSSGLEKSNEMKTTIMDPFATKIKRSDLSFWNKMETLDSKSMKKLPVWTSGTKLQGRPGDVFFFRGCEADLQEVFFADSGKWFSKDITVDSKKKIYLLKIKQHPTAGVTEDDLMNDEAGLPRKKVVTFFKDEGLFIVYYKKVKRKAQTPDLRGGKVSPYYLRPFLGDWSTLVTDQSSFFFEKNNPQAAHLETWTRGMRLDGQMGHVFVFKGSLEALDDVEQADGLFWNRTVTFDSPTILKYKCTLKEEKRTSTSEPHNLARKKRIFFFKNTSIYLVVYRGGMTKKVKNLDARRQMNLANGFSLTQPQFTTHQPQLSNPLLRQIKPALTQGDSLTFP